MGKIRRQFTREFKLQVVHEVEVDRTPAEVAREYEVHPNVVGKWRTQLHRYGERAFAGNGHAYTDEAQAAAKIAELERIIGQLTVENRVLKKVAEQLDPRKVKPGDRSY